MLPFFIYFAGMEIITADLCDKYSDTLKIAEPIGLKNYGGNTAFMGTIHTVKCFENNHFVRAALEQDGSGKVLLVDGGGSLRCALLGDMLGELAVKNHWNGVIVYGCIRDSAAMAKLPLGVKALNTHPLKSVKKNEGEENIALHFAGITFSPGEFLYSDEDGIVVSEKELGL